MTLFAANDRFAPSNVIDLTAIRRAKAQVAASYEAAEYGYLLTFSGKRRELTNLSTGRKLCALAR